VKLTALQKQSLEQATTHYQQGVGAAEEYLASRGISLQVASTHRLGVVGEPLTGHESYVGRLAIPYITKTGVIDIRFRSMWDTDAPKYLGLPGASTHLFNVTAAAGDTPYIAVCEGEMDTVTLSGMGIPAVGVPGVNNWKKHYARILQDFETVYVFADGDQPGQDFAKRLGSALRNVVVISMPDGEDVNSIYQKFGPNAIWKKLGWKVDE
jgi:DNA primase